LSKIPSCEKCEIENAPGLSLLGFLFSRSNYPIHDNCAYRSALCDGLNIIDWRIFCIPRTLASMVPSTSLTVLHYPIPLCSPPLSTTTVTQSGITMPASPSLNDSSMPPDHISHPIFSPFYGIRPRHSLRPLATASGSAPTVQPCMLSAALASCTSNTLRPLLFSFALLRSLRPLSLHLPSLALSHALSPSSSGCVSSSGNPSICITSRSPSPRPH
jgi:hypothetical protein